MACETLEEFQAVASYRKSFNADLQAAKSRPLKLVVLESFKFEKDAKHPALVLGAVSTALLEQLKKNAAKVKAEGKLAFTDNVVRVTLKSGTFTDGDLKKALEWAQVKREGVVGEDEAAEEEEGEQPLQGKAAASSAEFLKAKSMLEEFMKTRVAAMEWHDAEIVTQQDAEKKVTEVEAVIAAFRVQITAAEAKAKSSASDLKDARADKEAAKYAKAAITRIEKAIAAQGVIVAALKVKIDAQERKLVPLRLLANKHGSSRHGAQTDLGLQARRAATGGITPDQKDNVHGVSEQRVDNSNGPVEAPVTQVKWNKTTIEVVEDVGGKRKIVNATEVLKAVLTEVKDMAAVSTSTASKFLSFELEKEAVDRAIAMVEKNCKWSEVEAEGGKWQPIDAITVYLGPPREKAGWGFAMARQGVDKLALETANAVLEKFRQGRIDQKKMLADLDVAMVSIKEVVDGKESSSVPLVKSARVTVGRTGKGPWTSITHFPDPSATPAGWSLKGQFVRATPKDPKTAAPAGTTP